MLEESKSVSMFRDSAENAKFLADKEAKLQMKEGNMSCKEKILNLLGQKAGLAKMK